MCTVAALLVGVISALVGWAAGHVICTALFLFHARAAARYPAADTIAMKLFGAVFAPFGAAAGLTFVLRLRGSDGRLLASSSSPALAAMIAFLVGTGRLLRFRIQDDRLFSIRVREVVASPTSRVKASRRCGAGALCRCSTFL
jgi:hypothetical protein